MNRRLSYWAAGAAALVAAGGWATLPIPGQTAPKVGEWRTYGGDLASTRYSPLDQINADNFNKLEVAWRFKTDTSARGPSSTSQTDAADGRTACCTPPPARAARSSRSTRHRRDAVDAQRRRRPARRSGAAPALGPRPRVLDRRPDEERIIYVTPGYQLIALEREDRRPGSRLRQGRHRRSEAGRRSEDGSRHRRDRPARGAARRAATSSSSAPRTCPAARRKSKTNEKGYVRGYDVRTGKRLWIFHTIPRPGRIRQRHLGERLVVVHRQHRRLGADERRRGARARLPAGRAADRRLLRRPSARATACSARASSRSTSRPASASGTTSSCTTASGTWTSRARRSSRTSTSTAAPIKAIAQPTKQGWVYVFDRATGEPVWPIEERPVEKGNVPGEWYSPTQPFVTKPPPFDRQGVSIDDLIDFTPELRAEAVKIVSRYKIGPIFTPPVVSKWAGPLATLMLPTATGGANWQGGALDPETKHLLHLLEHDVSALGLVPATRERNPTSRCVQGTARDPNAPPPAGGGGGGRGGAPGGGGTRAASAGRCRSASGVPQRRRAAHAGGRRGSPPAARRSAAGGAARRRWWRRRRRRRGDDSGSAARSSRRTGASPRSI